MSGGDGAGGREVVLHGGVMSIAVETRAVQACVVCLMTACNAFGARCRHYLRSVAIGSAEACRRHDLLAAQLSIRRLHGGYIF